MVTIVFEVNDFLKELFPALKGHELDQDLLKAELVGFFSRGNIRPSISINGNLVTIQFDSGEHTQEKTDFDKATTLCNQKRFDEALPVLKSLIERNPTNSEYYRIIGQVLSEQGKIDDAIDYLIDALRWDPQNGYALIMMGNIFASQKDDIQTALTYYDQALKVDASDFLAMNNIGANLIRQGFTEKGKSYLERAYAINPSYPNTVYGLALVAQKQQDYLTAFDKSIELLKLLPGKHELAPSAFKLAMSVAQQIAETSMGENVFQKYRVRLEHEGEIQIDEVADDTIPTAARLELAENYGRPVHIIRYRPSYLAVEHLKVHELVHLDLIIQARKEQANKIFTSSSEHKTSFVSTLLSDSIKKLRKRGLGEEQISNFSVSLFEGMNRQMYNAPLDLFIEEFIYKSFPEFRPIQFVSINTIVKEGLQSVTQGLSNDIFPSAIVRNNKILNLVHAFQLKELYGVDIVENFVPTKTELLSAEGFYEEFKEYAADKAPGEEYELVQHWAEDLKLDKYFQLIDETEYRGKSDLMEQLSKIEEDPYDLQGDQSEKEQLMQKFQEEAAKLGLNFAVVNYMVDALNFMKGFSKEQIRQIAFESAQLGMHGIDPNKQGYKLAHVPGKSLSGYHLLAYYYVSWALFDPKVVGELGLPYAGEFNLAQSIFNINI